MSDIAGRLGQQIEAVQQERERVTIEMRRAAVQSRNEKARRLVSRLEDCDEVRSSLQKRGVLKLTISSAEHCKPSLTSGRLPRSTRHHRLSQ
jgi:hypothetical protein